LLGHSAAVYSVTVSDDLLFVGHTRDLIRAWKISSGELVKALVGTHFEKLIEGHSGSVWKLIFFNSTLFSSSADATLKQWNITSGETIKTFIGLFLRITNFILQAILLLLDVLSYTTIFFILAVTVAPFSGGIFQLQK
jgi:WD40 repeat protein